MANEAKPARKGTTVSFHVSVSGFKRFMFFNRIAVEKIDKHKIAYFGLMTEGGLRDWYACVFTEETLQRNKPILTDYWTKIGNVNEELPHWNPPGSPILTDMAHVITMTTLGNEAEMGLIGVAVGPASQVKTGDGKFDSTPLALLRSDLTLQQKLLGELFGKNE